MSDMTEKMSELIRLGRVAVTDAVRPVRPNRIVYSPTYSAYQSVFDAPPVQGLVPVLGQVRGTADAKLESGANGNP